MLVQRLYRQGKPKSIIPMNKKNIIERIAKNTGITQEKAKEAVEAVMNLIRKELKSGNNVHLRGFGTFKVITTKETQCRHPKTKKLIKISPYRKIKFTPGKKLKKQILSD